MEVNSGGLGLTACAPCISRRSSRVNVAPVVGSVAFSDMYASIKRFSYTFPNVCQLCYQMIENS